MRGRLSDPFQHLPGVAPRSWYRARSAFRGRIVNHALSERGITIRWRI